MPDLLQIVCAACKKAFVPVGAALGFMMADPSGAILDHYKGMEIRVRVRRFGMHAWRCTIRIGDARHQALQSLDATLRATEEGVSRQAALAGAFIEAMALCDLLLEKRLAQ